MFSQPAIRITNLILICCQLILSLDFLVDLDSYNMKRKWERGRGMILLFEPRVGPIDKVHVDFKESWMLAGSLERGKSMIVKR